MPSIEQSGEHWLKIRDQQIAAKNNTESAFKQIANELNIDLISLTPVLEEAAQDGELLYYPLDPHWNAEGTEIAASFVAESLKSKYFSGSTAGNR